MKAIRKAVLLGTVSGLLAATPAWASDAPADDAAPQEGEIIVTAQRRGESLNQVPMAVQAVTGETLKDLRVTDVRDLTAVAPSFTVSQSYQGVPTYTLRGIGFNTINLSATSTVGTYVDEVAYAYPIMNTGPMFDLERVEVLKGPQGTLYGRNTIGGAVAVGVSFAANKINSTALAEVNAATERQAAQADTEKIDDKYERLRAQQRAGAAKGGLDVAAGSPSLIINQETSRNSWLDQQSRIWSGATAATAQENKAEQFKMEAKSARQAGAFGAASSFLSGLGGAVRSSSTTIS